MDWEDANHEVHQADWREVQHQLEGLEMCRNRDIGEVARGLRDSYRQHLCTQTRVPWQYARTA